MYRRFFINISLYTILFFSLFLSMYTGIIRYVFFSALVSITLLFYLNHNIKLFKRETYAFIIILLPSMFVFVYTLILFIFKQDMSFITYTLRDILFFTMPIFAAYVIIIYKLDKNIIINIMLIVPLVRHAIFMINRGSLIVENEITPYSLSILCLYYFHKKKYLLFIITLLCIISGDKRIVFGALIFSLIIQFLLNKIKKHNTGFIIFLETCCIISQLIYVYLIHSGKLINIFQYYGIYDMGRLYAYGLLKNHYDLSITFAGHGIGFVTYTLSKIDLFGFDILHSDILKFYIELGLLGIIVYNMFIFNIIFYIKKVSKNINNVNLIFSMFVFTISLYTVDNLSIFFSYLIPLYVFTFLSLENEDV